MKKHTVIHEENIRLLVDGFYHKVRQHATLRPVFENTIGTEDTDWQPHLQQMYDFWSSLMLTSGKYQGNPMQKHMKIPRFDKALFDAWLKLFLDTAESLYSAEIVALYQEKSARVAQSLKHALYERA